MGIPILDEMPMETKEGYDVIVDAIFGFSFRGTAPREPFATAIANMVELQKQQKSLLVSVDVPSGWDVDGGDLTGTNFRPDVLVSLTAPKLSSKKFLGRHFVGGRFLPPAIAEKYGIRVSEFVLARIECLLLSFLVVVAIDMQRFCGYDAAVSYFNSTISESSLVAWDV